MRTTLAEHAFDRRGNDDEHMLARDNPRRQGDPHNERESNGRNATSRSPLRHGVQHVRDDLRRLTRG